MKNDRKLYQKRRYNRLKREGQTVLHMWLPEYVLKKAKRAANKQDKTLRQYVRDCIA